MLLLNMAKSKNDVIFLCSSCGNEFGRWAGQCPVCKEWNSLREAPNYKKQKTGNTQYTNNKNQRIEPINLARLRESSGEVKKSETVFSSNIGEFDRVLGKGIVRGSVVLFSGEPGIGKSTLLTQLVGNVGGLYVAGEESAEQIGMRVERMGLNKENFDILGTNSVEEIIGFLERTNNVYKIAVIDSIQVMGTENVTSAMGSPAQIRESTFRLVEAAKRLGVAMFIVGHVTKDGDIAGPKLLEHMVDTVLYFEGEKNGDLRILRATKNRFGANDEVGVFRMEEKGLKEVRSDEINLVEGSGAKIGSAVTVVMEGSRPMMVEIQALVTESFAPVPKRVFSGIDFNRGQLLVAVAQKVLGIPLYNQDVFVAVSGGVRIEETGADMAVVGAMYSSFKNSPIFEGNSKIQITKNKQITNDNTQNRKEDKTQRSGIVLCGEVTLLGEVRKVKGWERRKKEAESMGRKMMEVSTIQELKKLI